MIQSHHIVGNANIFHKYVISVNKVARGGI